MRADELMNKTVDLFTTGYEYVELGPKGQAFDVVEEEPSEPEAKKRKRTQTAPLNVGRMQGKSYEASQLETALVVSGDDGPVDI